MEENNLPKKESIFDRFKRAFSVLTGKDQQAGLQERENAVAEREANVEKREESLQESYARLQVAKEEIQQERAKIEEMREQIKQEREQLRQKENALGTKEENLTTRTKEANAQAQIYREENRISEDIPEIQVHATAVIAKRMSDLQKEAGELNERFGALDEVKGSKVEREMLQEELAKLKGKTLGEIAVMMETMTPHEISTTMIGEQKASVGWLAERLPRLLGVAERSAFALSQKETEALQEGISEAFVGGIDDLRSIGFLQGEARDRVDYQNAVSSRDGIGKFLNKYFGTEIPTSYGKFQGLRNYKKPENMQEMGIVENPVIGHVVEEITDMGNDR